MNVPERVQRWTVDPATGCWLWDRPKTHGYGQVWWDGTNRRAHRVIYELLVGPIPVGLQIDHLCRTPACVNPAHLEPVTARENTLRSLSPTAVNARKSHCQNGHPFDEANTLVRREGFRVCRICHGEYGRQRRVRLKDAS